MIYYILRPIVKWTLRLYFRKIYLSGIDKIPKDKAIIFASNHPSAFIEPCVLACFLPIQLHFLVRGDLFSLGWLSWLLRGTNQIPIFRQRDGLDNVKKNLITQEKVRELFAKNKALLMFPEAHTHENIYLKPLKKGIARFAFMDHGADCYVVPIGVNFDQNISFNSKVSVVIGEPIRVEDYKKMNDLTQAKQMNLFLSDLAKGMKKSLRHIDEIEREDTIHKIYRSLDNEREIRALPIQSSKRDVFDEEKKVADVLDNDENKFEGISKLISENTIRKAEQPSVLDKILMFVLAPLFLIGFLLHFIPDRIAKLVVFNKIKVHEFKSAVYIAMFVFQYIVIFSLLFLLLLIYKLPILLFTIVFVVSGLFSIYYLKNWGNKLKYIFNRPRPNQIATEIRKIIFE